jgi:hypothetical protein
MEEVERRGRAGEERDVEERAKGKARSGRNSESFDGECEQGEGIHCPK